MIGCIVDRLPTSPELKKTVPKKNPNFQREEKRREKKRITECHLCMYGDSIKKPTKYCFLKGGRVTGI
jgi:hypothetical protein